MTDTKLTKRETALLTEAAGRDDRVVTLPSGMKAAGARKLTERLLSLGLIVPCVDNGVAVHCLAPAGYRAVGVMPPVAPAAAAVERGVSKREMVVGLLARDEGASLDEVIAATGWLRHTTRAELSRLRSAGRELTKSTREDGRTVYRIAAAGAAGERLPAVAG